DAGHLGGGPAGQSGITDGEREHHRDVDRDAAETRLEGAAAPGRWPVHKAVPHGDAGDRGGEDEGGEEGDREGEGEGQGRGQGHAGIVSFTHERTGPFY